MSLKLIQDRYTYYTNTASTLCRQLGFAGIAVIWVFRHDVPGAYAIPEGLYLPSIAILTALTLDIIHYLAGATIWSYWLNLKDAEGATRDIQFEMPKSYHRPVQFLFYAKIFSMVFAYCLILTFLYQEIQSF